MKKQLFWFILPISILASCNVQKQYHSSGWHWGNATVKQDATGKQIIAPKQNAIVANHSDELGVKNLSKKVDELSNQVNDHSTASVVLKAQIHAKYSPQNSKIAEKISPIVSLGITKVNEIKKGVQLNFNTQQTHTAASNPQSKKEWAIFGKTMGWVILIMAILLFLFQSMSTGIVLGFIGLLMLIIFGSMNAAANYELNKSGQPSSKSANYNQDQGSNNQSNIIILTDGRMIKGKIFEIQPRGVVKIMVGTEVFQYPMASVEKILLK